MRMLTTPGGIADLACRAAAAGDTWHRPLFREAMANRLRLIIVPPGDRVPVSMLDPTRDRRPLMVILAGDGAVPVGPDAFPQAARLLRWCGFVMLHAAGGQAEHYEIAATAAAAVGRVVIAETGSDHLAAWNALRLRCASGTPATIVKVPEGQGGHPVLHAPAGVVIQ